MATLINDIVTDICNALKVPCQPLTGNTADDWNEELDEAGASGRPIVLFELAQKYGLIVTPSRYGYLEYNVTLLFVVMTADDSTATARNAMDAMLQLAYEFYSKLTEQSAWQTEPTNISEPMRIECAEVDRLFDSLMTGVSTTVTIRLNPSFDRSNICS